MSDTRYVENGWTANFTNTPSGSYMDIRKNGILVATFGIGMPTDSPLPVLQVKLLRDEEVLGIEVVDADNFPVPETSFCTPEMAG